MRDLYRVGRDAALIQDDVTTVLANNAKTRDPGDKAAEKLTSGLTSDAAAAARAAGDDPEKRKEAFTKTFAAAIDPLPWAIVSDNVIGWRA